MIQPLTLAMTALIYLALLFVIAAIGDRNRYTKSSASRSLIYPLSLAVYCTTWTFFGSVGVASTSGYDFLAIYLGPILLMTVGFPIVRRIIAVSKRQRITSIADFIGARYGKSIGVAAVATIISVIGAVPYVTLQLKAMSDSISHLVFTTDIDGVAIPVLGEVGLVIVIALGLFTILFGTRHADATEHQDGMMLAIAIESAIKLFAFLTIGIFVTFFMFDGFGDLFTQAADHAQVRSALFSGFDPVNIAVLTFLSFSAFLVLPRQFHVAVVENHSERELRRARWLFPLYLIAINLFVLPIAAAGVVSFGHSVNGDVFVLALPEAAGSDIIAMIAFIGGLSAGSAMVIVACVALAIMISNHLVLPILLRGLTLTQSGYDLDMEKQILNVRRVAILVILALAYSYFRISTGNQGLAAIGLVSFVAAAQLAPAIFGGLFWRGANSVGAITGMSAGIIIWFLMLLLPTISADGTDTGVNYLSMFSASIPGFSPLATGFLISLSFNTFGLILGSLLHKPTPLEDHQATMFVLFETNQAKLSDPANRYLTIQQIQENLYRYLGKQRADRAMRDYWDGTPQNFGPHDLASNDLIRYSEETLASAIGSSSSRLVHSLLLLRFEETSSQNLRLLDQATQAIEYNQNVLRTAFDQLETGITVFDSQHKLSFWNRQFRQLLDLPETVGRAGVPLSEIAGAVRDIHRLSEDDGKFDDLEHRLQKFNTTWGLALDHTERILEIRSSPMPSGGFVVAWNDVTERVMAAEALKEANESLEMRVEERTGDLVRANSQLEQARKEAEVANQSKTRFLAAAGHDLMQPLNAARLYTSTLVESTKARNTLMLGDKISMSLESVEEILGSVLAISRLDSASHKINVSASAVQKLFDQIELEFRPLADDKNLEINFVPTGLWVQSDPAYLRRLLQNLVSNAIKYTSNGKILVGCRRRGERVLISVYDTGIGFDETEHRTIFKEFKRLDTGAKLAPGLGLGLSIVERISRLLKHPISLSSVPGKGTHFEIELPRAAAQTQTQTSGTAIKALQKMAGLKVLCIDNDYSILDGMAGLLSQWGCKVEIAVDRDKALAIIERALTRGKLPDIALVDYHLENDDTGLSLIKDLRKQGIRDMPCILVTADRSTDLKKTAEEAGVTVLNKPVRPAALRAVLSQVNRQRSAAAAE